LLRQSHLGVRAFGVAKVGVNADIGSANQEWIYGSGGWRSEGYGSQGVDGEVGVLNVDFVSLILPTKSILEKIRNFAKIYLKAYSN
jgi:hypothetical protein